MGRSAVSTTSSHCPGPETWGTSAVRTECGLVALAESGRTLAALSTFSPLPTKHSGNPMRSSLVCRASGIRNCRPSLLRTTAGRSCGG